MKDSDTASSVEGNGCFSELYKAVRDKYVNTTITYLLISGFIYLTIIALLSRNILHPLTGYNNEFSDEMTNNILSIFVLLLTSLALGWVVSVIRIPALFGALLTGIAFTNIPLLSETFSINSNWQNIIRVAALACIMAKWGLGLRWAEIRRRPVLPLAVGIFTPLIEAACVGVAAYFLFHIDVALAVLAGFLLAAVSPAVTVPILIDIQNDGRGEEKVVPGLLAAASLDNVICIIGVTTSVSSIFSNEVPSMTVLLIFLQIFSGIIAGIVVGVLLWFFPLNTEANCGVVRSLILGSATSAAFIGFNSLGWTCAGVISAIMLSLIASRKWKVDNDKGTKVQESLADSLWSLIFMPLLFASIGMKLNISYIHQDTVLLSLVLIAIGLAGRFISTIIISSFCFNLQESIFAALTMLPKATVQAALSPALLGFISMYPEMEEQIQTIVTAAILSIFVTAPIGQLLIQLLAPALLRRESPKIPTFIYNHYDNEQRTDTKDIILNGIGSKSFIKADEVSLRF